MHDDAWRSYYANMFQQLLWQVVWLPTFVLQWLHWALQGLDARMLEELALMSNLAEYQQIPFWTCRFILDGSGKKGWHGQDNKEQYKPTKNRLQRQNQQHVYIYIHKHFTICITSHTGLILKQATTIDWTRHFYQCSPDFAPGRLIHALTAEEGALLS